MSEPNTITPRFRHRRRTLLLSLLAGLVLGGCATPNRFEQRTPVWGDSLHSPERTTQIADQTPIDQKAYAAVPDENLRVKNAEYYKPGTGVVLQSSPTAVADARPLPDGDIKLNFQNANLLEVIKIILGDMLGITYTVDAEVQGLVSMQTSGALHRDDLIPTLELLLRMNNAALITTDNIYRVVPLSKALAQVRAPQLGDSSLSLPGGFNVIVLPLRHVAAEEMAQILEPFVSTNNQLLRVDTARNLLILAGNGSDLERLTETVRVFDVDRMAGMSVALFTPEYVDAETLAGDLESLLADPQYGLMPGLVRFIVVKRLNGLMVVTPRAEHLTQVRNWVRRLDRNTGDANPRLFIYRVQNGKAAEIAEQLNSLFNPGATNLNDEAELAPDLTPVTLGRTESAQTTGETTPATMAPSTPAPAPGGSGPGIDIDPSQQVRIIADEANNALMILARGTDYRQILTALKQIDVSPMQVLIEVTIAQVLLTDNLRFGVEWFFKNNFGSKTGEGLLDLGDAGLNTLRGFSYALRGPDVRFVLNALATESNISIISSPSLLVLNNQEASIQVGDEVPVATQERQSTIDPDAPLVSTVEYRDTGVLLNVKPRVNAGGLVIMEVEQEVSTVPSTTDEDTLTPRIQTRKISSTVAVNSGDTIILGGLIQQNRDLSEAGIPFFHKVPFLGALFGTKEGNQDRNELIVLITPRAISNSTAALQVTEEYRRRLRSLIPERKTNSAVMSGAGVEDGGG